MSEEIPPILGKTLELINQLEHEGLIKQPTLAGAIALIYYSQPFYTDIVDFYCHIPNQVHPDPAPIYKRLEELGCEAHDGYINVRGVDVRFLVAANQPLVEEALENATDILVEGVKTRVFEYEYALSVNAEAGKTRDWGGIAMALESADPNKEKLDALLTKYGLLEKWTKQFDGCLETPREFCEIDYRNPVSIEDIYKAKAQDRRKQATKPFERKLLTLVKLQAWAHTMAESAGRTPRKPWHADDDQRMEKYAQAWLDNT